MRLEWILMEIPHVCGCSRTVIYIQLKKKYKHSTGEENIMSEEIKTHKTFFFLNKKDFLALNILFITTFQMV